MLGQAVGAAIFSPLSDRYGRRPINILSRCLYLIAGVTAMFSPSIAVFSVFRLLIGTFQGVSNNKKSLSVSLSKNRATSIYGRRPINILSRSLYLIDGVTAMFSTSILDVCLFQNMAKKQPTYPSYFDVTLILS